MAMRKGAASTRDPILRRAKIKQAMELVIQKGLPAQDVANLMNVGRKTMDNWRKEAHAKGIIDEIRERMEREQLPKALKVYDDILDADVDVVTDKRTVKAHELKLKAARDMMQGLGALRKDSTQVKIKQTLDLEGYAELRAARNILAPRREDASGVGRLESPDVVEGRIIVGALAPTQELADNGANWQYRLSTPSAEVPGQAAGGGILPGDDADDADTEVDGRDGGTGDVGSQEGGRADLSGEGTADDPEVDFDGDGAV